MGDWVCRKDLGNSYSRGYSILANMRVFEDVGEASRRKPGSGSFDAMTENNNGTEKSMHTV